MFKIPGDKTSKYLFENLRTNRQVHVLYTSTVIQAQDWKVWDIYRNSWKMDNS